MDVENLDLDALLKPPPTYNAKQKSDLPDVPVDKLDFSYVETCEDATELRDILTVLESGKEGYYPDLTKAVIKRMLVYLPKKEARLFINLRSKPTFMQEAQAKSEIDEWASSFGGDTSKAKKTSGQRKTMPPVRNHHSVKDSSGAVAGAASTAGGDKPVRIDPKSKPMGDYYRDWQKYDVDAVEAELDAQDKAEEESMERRRQQQLREINAARQADILEEDIKKLGIKLDKVQDLSKQERVTFARREKQKGNECFKAREFEQALKYYSKSLIIDRSNAVVWANRAMARLKLEQYERAEQDCTEAISIDPTYLKAISRRGMARHHRGKYKEAAADYARACELDPENKDLVKLRKLSERKYEEVEGVPIDGEHMKPRATFQRIQIESGSDSEEEEEEEEEEDEGDAGGDAAAAAAELPPKEENEVDEQVQELKAEGMKAFASKDFDLAAKYFGECIKLNMWDPKMFLNQAAALLKSQSLNEEIAENAVDSCNQALDLLRVDTTQGPSTKALQAKAFLRRATARVKLVDFLATPRDAVKSLQAAQKDIENARSFGNNPSFDALMKTIAPLLAQKISEEKAQKEEEDELADLVIDDTPEETPALPEPTARVSAPASPSVADDPPPPSTSAAAVGGSETLEAVSAARAAKKASADKKAAEAVETARKQEASKRKFKAPKNMYELKKTFHQFSHDRAWLLEYVCSIKFSKWKKLFGKGSVDVEGLSTVIELLVDAEKQQLTRGYSILKIVAQSKSIGMALMLLSDTTLKATARVFSKFESHIEDSSAVAALKAKFGI